MTGKFSNLLIVVLLITAIGLGYKIWEKNGKPLVQLDMLMAKKPNNSPTSKEFSKELPSSASAQLTEEELTILNSRKQNSSEEDKKKFQELVAKKAITTSKLDITDCKPSPVIARIKQKGELSLSNTGSSPRELVIDAEHIYKVLPGKETVIKVEFGKNAGIYGFGCDLSGQAVGVFLVTE